MALRLNFFKRYALGRGARPQTHGAESGAPRPTPRLGVVPPRRALASLQELPKALPIWGGRDLHAARGARERREKARRLTCA